MEGTEKLRLPSRLRGNSGWSAVVQLFSFSANRYEALILCRALGIQKEITSVSVLVFKERLCSDGLQRSMRHCLALREFVVSAYLSLFHR